MSIKKIVVLGAGNLAKSFISSLKEKDINVLQIYNRHIEKIENLAKTVNAEAIDNIENLSQEADAFFFMLSDTGIVEIVEKIQPTNAILLHSAGSVPIDIFKNKSENYGVFYPFQTFSVEAAVDFYDVPLCVNASNEITYNKIKNFAKILNCKIIKANEEERKYLHLSGVFACNFMNHCICIAEKILESKNLDKKLLLPLLKQSFNKVLETGAYHSQTGPAIRNDSETIAKHLEILKNDKILSEIYKIMTDSIINLYN